MRCPRAGDRRDGQEQDGQRQGQIQAAQLKEEDRRDGKGREDWRLAAERTHQREEEECGQAGHTREMTQESHGLLKPNGGVEREECVTLNDQRP